MARYWGKSRKFLLPIIGLVFILLVNFTGLARVRPWLEEPLRRIGGGFYGAGRAVNNFWQGLTRGFYLQAELARQEYVISQLARANTDLQFLADANRDLRALWGLKDRPLGQTLIPAEVVWLNSGAQRSLLTINRGQADGVAAKMPVVALDGVFIGKVLTATPHTATVLLTIDRDSAVAATSAHDQNLQAIVKGKMGLGLSLELIPQDAVIAVGDIIITSALEENTPVGLSLGRVAGVFYKEGELFKRANLEPLVTLPALRAVAVLAPSH